MLDLVQPVIEVHFLEESVLQRGLPLGEEIVVQLAILLIPPLQQPFQSLAFSLKPLHHSLQLLVLLLEKQRLLVEAVYLVHVLLQGGLELLLLGLQALVLAVQDEELLLEGFADSLGGLLLGMLLAHVHDIYMELKWAEKMHL